MRHYWTHDDKVLCSNKPIGGRTGWQISTSRELGHVSCPDCCAYIEAAIQRYQIQRDSAVLRVTVPRWMTR